MAAIASWYNRQYAPWNRTRRLHAPTYLARVDTNVSRNAATLRQANDTANGVAINMGDLAPPAGMPGLAGSKEHKDTLFGPSIGAVGTAPDWCSQGDEEKRGRHEGDEKDAEEDDELTPSIVKEWVKRSAESSEPTTTLQALVNLKRPSIRLSPLALPPLDHSVSADSHQPQQQQQHHGLEFEFDCDAPKCAISLHIIGVPAHLGEDQDQDATHSREALVSTTNLNVNGNDAEGVDRLQLFEATVDGGFARRLTLGAGAVLELARLETAAQAYRRAKDASAEASGPAPTSSVESVVGDAEAGPAHAREHRKRMAFFRRKGNHVSADAGAEVPTATAGPALAVVDAEATAHQQQQLTQQLHGASPVAAAAAERIKDTEEGVKVAICLSARDAEGRPLRVRNEQVTYLHVVRNGTPPVAISSASLSASSASGTGEGEATSASASAGGGEGSGNGTEARDPEVTRPWVVKVVKREARIGAHTFHLHEIYGLTSHAEEPAHALVPSPEAAAAAHTYPPVPHPGAVPGAGVGEDVRAECLLCLSAPREVVLLPCRHLVACRECAVNMVEFGAGGTVAVVAESEGGGATGNSNNATGNANTNRSGSGAGEGNRAGGGNANAEAAPPSGAAPPTPPTTARRRRKAKGWFCPVCRQPYTSLLRITTAPPTTSHPARSGADAGGVKRVSLASSLEPEPEAGEGEGRPLTDSGITPGQGQGQGQGTETAQERGTEGRARPGFLSRLTSLGSRNVNEARDLERGA